MFFLNFTAGEFLLLLGTFAGIVTALYLFDRSKSKKVVSTLRFWTLDVASAQQKSRKRMREPWSFVLQLVSILLLLLAIGQLEWGRGKHRNRKNVLLLDTSAWSSEIVKGRSLLEAEKAAAAQYLKHLPSTDLVLVAGVDASAAPATVFTSNRTELLNALTRLEPSFSALDLHRALSFARRIQALSAGAAGEVVYVGPGIIKKGTNTSSIIQNLRTIVTPADEENCGIRSIGLRRNSSDPKLWSAIVTVKNYGRRLRTLRLTSRLSGSVLDTRLLTIRPSDQAVAEYSFMRAAKGELTVSIAPGDALHADDRALVSIPGNSRMRLAVFTTRPGVLNALVQPDENLEAHFFLPAQYTPRIDADAVLLDQFAPAALPQIPALWIAPPRDQSPIPVMDVVDNAVLSASDAVNGMHAQGGGPSDVQVRNAEVFTTADGDSVFAAIAKGPVGLGRQGPLSRLAVLGFDPFSGDLRFRSATPLLFASMLRWLSPESMRPSIVTTGFAGETTIALPLQNEIVSGVTDENGTAVPFNVQGQLLQVSATAASQLHVQFREGASMSLPILADVAGESWIPPANSTERLSSSNATRSLDIDLWRWLAFFGGVGFLADWLLFGRKNGGTASTKLEQADRRESRASELVQR